MEGFFLSIDLRFKIYEIQNVKESIVNHKTYPM
jgi:hypothetical protein